MANNARWHNDLAKTALMTGQSPQNSRAEGRCLLQLSALWSTNGEFEAAEHAYKGF